MPQLNNDYSRLSSAAHDFLFRDHQMVIDGQEVAADNGETIAVLDPSNGKTVGSAPAAGDAEIDRAVRAARKAFDHGPWPRMSPGERERIMLKFADLVERDRMLLAEIESVESGRVLGAVAAFDSDLSASCLRYMAGWATKLTGKTMDLTAPYAPGMKFFAYTQLAPVGVVAAITPWNVPLCQAAWKIAPALAAGCTVVLKPSEMTPLGALQFAKLALEAGIPAGVVNVVSGNGRTAGAALVSHPMVDKISFTGSTAVGREIARIGAEGMKKVTLELGGKSPMVVLGDADLAKVIPGAAMGIYANHGQNCCAGSRLYVHSSIYDKVVAGIADVAASMVLGSGLDPDSQMGPLASKGQQDRVLGFVERGVASGAELVTGGTSLDHEGAYVRPTILADVDHGMEVVRDEIFGPVLSVMRFDDEDKVIELANDSVYGLGASIWTQDVNKVHRFAEAFRAGTVWVNTHNILDMAMPFGGVKSSGIGHDLGEEAVLQNCQVKANVINLT
ncbi:aldehyde dehydrogenase family protein [Croceicoccus sediminis]|uniref:aldehyde dehydrogenase family protein n=1 Tax=Croceicoccus sediminis TaxID=2571150 RepID=UPI0011829C49|nr:aldehyde dehydrogenase family protein [Croceicoccus sediminis]